MLHSNKFFLIIVLLSVFLGGCGGDTTPDSEVAAVDPCADYVGQATPEEIALTPRADEEAELLAIEATGLVVAPQTLYDRISTDLANIRTDYPYVAHVNYRGSWLPHTLLFRLDDQGYDAYKAKTYTAWNCANNLYGLSLLSNSPSGLITLVFPATLDMAALATEYAQLPNVLYVEPNYMFGDGPDICLLVDGDNLHYVFDDASGSDCPSGCSNHLYSAFTSDSTGLIIPNPIMQQIPIIMPEPLLLDCLPQL